MKEVPGGVVDAWNQITLPRVDFRENRGTECTPAGGDGNIAEAFGALLGRRVGQAAKGASRLPSVAERGTVNRRLGIDHPGPLGALEVANRVVAQGFGPIAFGPPGGGDPR